MKKVTLVFITAISLTWASLSNADRAESPDHVPVENLKWFATGIGPMQAAVAYGDMAVGPYGVFLKFPGGFVSPVHQHTSEYRAVVIGGTVVNSEVGEKDITLRPGSSWYQRGKNSHVTKCVSKEGCTVFLSQPGKFDFNPTEQ